MPLDTIMHLLDGARVLVLAVDCFSAAEFDLLIEDAGGRAIALASSLHDALTVLGRENVDAAVLDLHGHDAASAAEALRAIGLPFALHQGSEIETIEALGRMLNHTSP